MTTTNSLSAHDYFPPLEVIFNMDSYCIGPPTDPICDIVSLCVCLETSLRAGSSLMIRCRTEYWMRVMQLLPLPLLSIEDYDFVENDSSNCIHFYIRVSSDAVTVGQRSIRFYILRLKRSLDHDTRKKLVLTTRLDPREFYGERERPSGHNIYMVTSSRHCRSFVG